MAEQREQDPSKPVVTLFEAYGSGASYVGMRLAKRLGVPFFDQKYSSAQLEAAEEAEEGWIGRLLRTIAASGAGLDSTNYRLYDAIDDDLVAHNDEALRDLLADGGVVLGRNATVILAGRSNVFHAKLDGPEAIRVARAAAAGGISQEQARERLEREDRARAEMSLRLYGWDPRTSGAYDVVLNTGTYDLDTCVELLLQCRELKLNR